MPKKSKSSKVLQDKIQKKLKKDSPPLIITKR